MPESTARDPAGTAHARGRARAGADARRVRAGVREAGSARPTRWSWRCTRCCGASTAPTSTPRSCCARCPPRARTWSWARARTRARWTSAAGWCAPSRSSRTTTPARSSPSRAPPPASGGSCATSSPSARGRSRCSTRCASASPRATVGTALALPARRGGRGHRPLRQLDRRAHDRRRGLLRGALRAELPGQRDGARPGAARAAGPQRRRRPRQRARAVRRLHRPRRDRRRLGARLRRARARAGRADKRPTVQVGDPFEEKKLLECSLRAARARPARLAAGPRRGRPDLLGLGDGLQGRGRDRHRRRQGARCARPTWSRSRSWSPSPRSGCCAWSSPRSVDAGARAVRAVGGRRRGHRHRHRHAAACACFDGGELVGDMPVRGAGRRLPAV